MRWMIWGTMLAMFAAGGCMVEEQGCATSADCGDGWICDPATGACIPIEEGDADPVESDLVFPDTDDAATSDDSFSTADISDQSDVSDVSYDADLAGDTDIFSDTDALADHDDTFTDNDLFLDASDVSLDTDTTTDTDPVADLDSPDEESDDDTDTDVPLPDTQPDTDSGCNDCSCPTYCHGHGVCTTAYGYPSCECDTGYAGSWCQQCDYAWQDHDGNGICEKDDCVHATAPGTGWLDCGPHGTCDDWDGMVPADCECDTYWIDMNGECDYCFASDPSDC